LSRVARDTLVSREERIALLVDNLQVALKEWASVCRALDQGRLLFLLRKGGILDNRGVFELEERAFLLFPTYLHQKRELLKPAEHEAFEEKTEEPQTITLSLAATVSDVVMAASREQIDAIDDLHVWTPPHIDMRFAYKPRNPLYLVLLRVYRLATPVTIENSPTYMGCRSWVPLDQSVSTSGAAGVLDDGEFEAKRRELLARLNASERLSS
jgi:hypothetical protein